MAEKLTGETSRITWRLILRPPSSILPMIIPGLRLISILIKTLTLRFPPTLKVKQRLLSMSKYERR